MGYLDFDRHGSFLSGEADFLRGLLRKVNPMAAQRGASVYEFHVRALTGSEAGHLDVRSKRKLVRRRGVVALMERAAAGGFMTVEAVRVNGRLTREGLTWCHTVAAGIAVGGAGNRERVGR